ncbi:hypothetical protein TMatcc_006509 [Talaromyces marneffei ATCC 18224]|uniref:Uncharacterized protein n=1 Tax=Talaromyces marneffei (strain ATCC 18224 / CBS 334.59 / QM 7333) TaxID=441960 RepID=B6QAE2_TALMQ|nr:uncharacterized protein EYB26_002553 [Talaromyces marneffei]EEA25269.1 conserved hypothetical protein [Talaromyces marneffei ATCC 18224]QGA14897.1 hypothetical protein EYB26_002553 [Talaromyces marneffei]
MPSFFSKKTRTQQVSSAGPAGESSSGSAVPPGPPPLPLPNDPYQILHQQQQSLEEFSDRIFDANRRPSEPFPAHQFHGRRPHSPHSPSPAGVDLRYGRDPEDQHQQQQQQYRHPAHHNPNQPSLDRPTISIVTPSQQQQQQQQQQNQNEPQSYQQSPDRARNSIDQQQWTTSEHNPSAPDLLHDSGKQQKKKKGFFSRNQTVASSNPATKQSAKKDKSLGRSASIKHSFGRDNIIQPPQSSSEYGRSVTTKSTSGHSLNQNQSRSTLDNTSQQFESETSLRPPTAETPASPNRNYEPSQPHTPLENSQSSQRLGADINDRGHLVWQQHRRSESFESIPSQTSSRRPSIHQILDSSVSDMATAQQPMGTRPSESQPQIPTRKDSLAAPSGQPHLQNALQGSFKNPSQQNLHDMQGRETPPSAAMNSKVREELENLDVGALIMRHEELQAKYQKVKRYYFEKEAQVTALQNTVAHQRMAVSRTVLDDNEYTARFQRLDGAIKELAFSIRKDWRAIPDWLHPFVNEDAVTVGTKEMTGVGRAVITRWVAEEVFNRYFHPGLERTFSERLKTIEMHLRRQQVQVFNEDDKENQVARISNWRRTTLDGLADMLQSRTTQENLDQLVEYLVEKLSAMLQCDLKEPAPPELAHYTRMIVENAINIAEKIPQEARDIVVDYISPGSFVSEINMKVETGLPPLTRPLADGKDDIASEGNEEMETDIKEQPTPPQQTDQQQGKNPTHMPQSREQRKKYPFGSLMSKKSLASTNPAPAQSQNPSQGTASSPDNATNNKERDEQLQQQQQQQQDKRPRVRLSTFMTVEVKGRGPNNVLIQAPVYTIE